MIWLVFWTLAASPQAQTGADLYRDGCAACHGADGKGSALAASSGMRVPDFSNCGFATSEPDLDWRATIHGGGAVRGLDNRMPAFAGVLSDDEILSVIRYVRGFCASRAWPHGDLNLPRSLVTDKAFPESEAFITTKIPVRITDRVQSALVYEHRVGPRSQIEAALPYNFVQLENRWTSGAGDLAVGFKQVALAHAQSGTIVSAGVDVTFPTGNEKRGLGGRGGVFESFGSFSQMLPRAAFLHAQVGVERPWHVPAPVNELFWRAAAGQTFTQAGWGRAWSPMVEVHGRHELAFDEPFFWDVLPQLQVTLSRRQHVALSGGVLVPVNRPPRTAAVVWSVLWDWGHGGLFSGWR